MQTTKGKVSRTQKMVVTGMLCALAYVVMVVGRVPMIGFLKYDPKDIIITIGGFIYGPFTAYFISLTVSLVEMVTVSGTGLWGMLMNVVSSVCFACTASFIYNKMRSTKGAVLGLLSSVVVTTLVMLLWNYAVSPLYMGITRETIAPMLATMFLPFNLIKSCINAALILLLYKPMVAGLRKSKMLPSTSGASEGKFNIGVVLTAIGLLITCLFLIMLIRDIWV